MSDFDLIYNELYPIVTRYVISKVDNISNTSDIVQNVFISFYKAYKKNGYIQNYKYFILNISKKEVFKYYKTKEKFKDLFSEIDFSFLENVVKSPNLIDGDFIKKYEKELVWEIIYEMDLETQKILTLHYLNELSLKDISISLSINESTVKSKLYRAISKIKERIGEE